MLARGPVEDREPTNKLGKAFIRALRDQPCTWRSSTLSQNDPATASGQISGSALSFR